MTKADRDDFTQLLISLTNKPSGPDWGKLAWPVLAGVCVLYLTQTIKSSESVPVISQKLDSIKDSMSKLESQIESIRGDSKSEFKTLEDRVRTLELSIFKSCQ